MSASPADLAALRAEVNRMLAGHLSASPEVPDERPERAAPEPAGFSREQQSTMNDQKDESPSAPRRRRTAPPRSKRATR